MQLRYMSNTFVEAEQIYLIMLRLRKILAKKTTRKGVPVRDYKKTKNILMGTPARESVKRVQKNLSSFYYFLVKSDNVNQEHRSNRINYAVTQLQQIILNFFMKKY